MKVLLDDPFAYTELPLIFNAGEPVPGATTTVRRAKIVWLPGAVSGPDHVTCGGEDGCGAYMIPTGRARDERTPARSWPVFACFLCDRLLCVRYGPEGRPLDDELAV